ncbi:MAG: hypothetical protein M3458_05315 [Acidobacteriota bacterium]|nr:hypothetical protein [Acidobacteriota bacterium]
MGFTKKTNSNEIAIEVTHQWHPGQAFTFYFPKQLPQRALDAERDFLGLKETERADEYRLKLISLIAEMAQREPSGFEDFPGAAQIAALRELDERRQAKGIKTRDQGSLLAEIEKLDSELSEIRRVSLPQRIREYFDDTTQPELEQIIIAAWRAYKGGALPSAYLKSVSRNGGGSGDVLRVPPEAEPAV